MTSKSHEQSKPTEDVRMNSGDMVVISGMSGLYPNSSSVRDFSQILYNKVNPITKTDYWKYNHPELKHHKGTLPDLVYFDAQFFKVHYQLSRNMDPTSRKMLEQAYQAIFDAGVNPAKLSGKKIGVFIGTSQAETENALYYTKTASGFAITGCSKTMFANRISYWLNAKGPSLAVDEACCSSTAALEMAYRAIKKGECEAALVGGSYICLHPQSSVNYGRTLNLSTDGRTKSFDKNSAGCAMSEAINMLFLQKSNDALRIYGEVVHAKCEFTSIPDSETGPQYGFYRNPNITKKFLNTFYKEVNISPLSVKYVEAFGSAMLDADKSELEAIDEIFCKTRNKPLLVGSVMSNVGYSNSATGITAVTKVLLGYHHGKLAANLHYETPLDIPALKEGRIEIVKKHAEFDRTYAAVNSLSITGINGHVLLYGHYKPKDINRYRASIPRIVLLSGRLESSVTKIIEDLKSRPIDPEEHALLHNFHETRITGHLGRGFVILDTNDKNETVSLCEVSEYFDEGKRPLWFVYSGMGSQWVGMGKELMRIPIFAAAIERCHRVLEPNGVNIVDIITSDDKNMFDNILNSFVGIAAIQIGLTDVLREMDIHPDMIIGHSLGEIGCAYADGCFTAEETILCAYSRGLVSIQTPLIRGSMAAVGLGYREISSLCPPEIEVACHNSPESSTISGPAEIMSDFVASLTSKEVFAKEVPCSNIAYHSRYIADAGPGMFKMLSGIITSPKLRSARWLSTSVPQDKWDEQSARYSSAEYHTNNLLNPVLFEETSKLIPSNAVLIEIAPHGLLQAILKRSLPPSCRLLPLTRRGHPDNAYFLLEAIGRLSMEGFDPKVKALYPKVEFPVSTSTPMLSHLVEWSHHEKWHIILYASVNKKTAASSKYVLSTCDDEHTYLKGHVIRGKNLYPYAAALVYVWDTFAMSLNLKPKKISVEFCDVFLHSQPMLHEQHPLRLNVTLHRGTGRFDVMNGNSLMLQGFIKVKAPVNSPPRPQSTNTNVCAEDVYQILHARDFHYKDDFRSIHSVNETFTEAQIEWKENWVTFIDGIIQLNILRQKHNGVSKLTSIKTLTIDIRKHKQITNNMATVMDAYVLEEIDGTKCGGIVLETPKFQNLPTLIDESISIKTLVPKDSKFMVEISMDNEIFPESDEILKISKMGVPNSLYWVKAVEDNSNGVEIKVKYAGVNSVYANNMMGPTMNSDFKNNNIIDFSGVAESGSRVMGIVQIESITSKIKANSEFLWPIPEYWSLEEAATVPLAYSMAFYILFVKTQLTASHTILVHGGAGALGQAIIYIALAKGCKIFTTVSSSSKRQFLRKLFPQLKDNQIGYSRDVSFVDVILSKTKGKGCDIVISNVKDELKNGSEFLLHGDRLLIWLMADQNFVYLNAHCHFNEFFLKCTSFNGIYFDMSLIHTSEDYNFGLGNLAGQKSYVAVDFTSVFQQEYLPDAKYIHTLMSEGIARGYVRPLSHVTFAPSEATRAFRLQVANHNRGRVLLDLQNLATNILPRITCSSSSWQLLISDNEIFALKVAERLVKRGARKIVFLLSNTSKCLDVLSRLWQEAGVKTKVLTDDIWKESNLMNEIQRCKEDGGLESIILMITNNTLALNDITDKFSAFIQKSCVSLKYFAVVSTNNVSNDETQVTVRDQQLITKIKLPVIDMMQTAEVSKKNNITLTINNAIDVLEKVLCFKHSTVLVQTKSAAKVPLFEQLLKVAGVRKDVVPENSSLDTRLDELITDHSKFQAIQVYLRDVYEVYLTLEDIKMLSITSIDELDKQFKEHVSVERRGLSCYFSRYDTDELLSTTEVVYLPTLLNNYLRDDDIDENKIYLNIVPGIEGHYSRFKELCERLKIPALVLQPGLDRPNETIPELAKRYVENLIQKSNVKDKFYLLGYESGVSVALEMAAILEGKGLTGTVFCLGGSPLEIHENFKQNLSIYKTNEHLQMAVLKHIYSLMNNENPDVLDELCNNLEWHEKVDACVRTLRSKFPHSIQYAKKNFETAYARLQSMLQYAPTEPNQMLQSQIISLRPNYPTRMDSSLQNYSHQKVISYQLQAPLSTLDSMCTTIINRHLDKSILEDFNASSLCEAYYIEDNKMFSNS